MSPGRNRKLAEQWIPPVIAALCRSCLGWMAIPVMAFMVSTGLVFGQQPSTASPCDPSASLKRADQLLKEKRYGDAESILARLRQCPRISPLVMFNIGWFYGRAHNFQTALGIFKSVSPDVPDLRTHQYAIGLGEFELGDYKAAVETLKVSQSQGLLNSDSANLLGVSYSKLGQYQDAYTVLSDEIHRDPSDLFAYFNLVTLFADAGKFTQAVDVANEAVVRFPGNSDVLVVRGAAYTLSGEVNKAHDDFASAAHLSPIKSQPRFLLALSDYKQGNFELSAAELKEAIRDGVVDSDLHYLLAECMLKLDPTKPEEAIAELNRAVALNSASASARTLRGKLWLEQNRLKDAANDLQIAHHVDPSSRSATYNLARADMALGKQAEAKQLYSQLNQQPTDTVSELGDRKIKEALANATAQ
jgi:tetratricopeptide (TPR) repeat protein